MIKLEHFDNELNSKKNLKIAKKLLSFYNCKKGIKKELEIYYCFTYESGETGHRGYLKLNEKGKLKIINKNYLEIKEFVNINIKKL